MEITREDEFIVFTTDEGAVKKSLKTNSMKLFDVEGNPLKYSLRRAKDILVYNREFVEKFEKFDKQLFDIALSIKQYDTGCIVRAISQLHLQGPLERALKSGIKYNMGWYSASKLSMGRGRIETDIPAVILKKIKEADITIKNIRVLYDLSRIKDINILSYIIDNYDMYEEGLSRGELYRGNEEFERLINTYKCNYKYLFNYLRYLYNYENISPAEAMRLLGDTLNLANLLEEHNGSRMNEYRKVLKKKYPKYLKSMHDILAAEYSRVKVKIDEKKFKELYEEYKKQFEYSGKDFSIVFPENSGDIKMEGEILNHCVNSYVGRILSNRCAIIMCRNVEDLNNPLLTLEISKGELVQVRGARNRNPNAEEKKFLDEFCKARNIKNTVWDIGE